MSDVPSSQPSVKDGVFLRDTNFKLKRSWSNWLIGKPLSTADMAHQTIGKAVGLAVFASDALSSTAYATQEILVVLAAAGAIAFGYAFPISIAIVILLAIVTVSYEQIIHVYPDGGGAYIVARDNLGDIPALIAGAALLTDYILTVAVSISSGVAQLASASPTLAPYRVPIAVVLVMVIMLVNLRGVRESGTAFAIPTFFFLVTIVITIGIGFFRYFSGTLGTVVDPPALETAVLAPLSLFLILRAFSSGTTALTGVEAISNGITAFREPRSRNAGITLIWMSLILGTLFLSITFLSVAIHAIPSEHETVISQLVRTVFDGKGTLYLATITATTIILIMAANTAFAGFPRLSALVAADGFLPRQLTFRGSRLVYSRGIVTLALIASLLIILFNASVTALIPLYAIGVFLSFTFSQGGMARRWWKAGQLTPGTEIKETGSVVRYDTRWKFKMIVNGFGAACTAGVMMIFAVTKFTTGAWIILILTPVLVMIFWTIHKHYQALAKNLSLTNFDVPVIQLKRHRVILPISGVHRGTLQALNYARSLTADVTAVHVSIDPLDSEKTRQKWDAWGNGTRLVVLDSPYRQLMEPLLEYIETLTETRQNGEIITIIVPQFVPAKGWQNVLHSQTAFWLRNALFNIPDVVIIEVPYQT